MHHYTHDTIATLNEDLSVRRYDNVKTFFDMVQGYHPVSEKMQTYVFMMTALLVVLITAFATQHDLPITSLFVQSYHWLITSNVWFPEPPLKNYPRREDGSIPRAQLPTPLSQARNPKLAKNQFYQYKQGEHCPYLGFAVYDSLVFVQHWPTTLCHYSLNNYHFCNATMVREQYSSEFMALSVRPANLRRRVRGHIMTQCCDLFAQYFVYEDMMSGNDRDKKAARMKRQLLKHWPDFIHTDHRARSMKGLYAHEWIKYGTCLSLTPYDHANLVLHMKKKLPLYRRLKRAKLLRASIKELRKSEVLDALKLSRPDSTPIYPLLVCSYSLSPFTKPVLFEVWNCFDRITMEPVQCTQHEELLRHSNECPDDFILLPDAATLSEYQVSEDGTITRAIRTKEKVNIDVADSSDANS